MRDEELDRLLGAIAPVPPPDLTDRVMARVSAVRARRRLVGVGAVGALLAAAAVLLWVRPGARAVSPATEAGWRVVEAAHAGVEAGTAMPVGSALTPAASGYMRLRESDGRGLDLRGGASARLLDVGLALVNGTVQLAGDAVVATTDLGKVTTIGADALVAVRLERSDEMNTKTKLAAGAIGAAVLTVTVLQGGARVEAADPPRTTTLAQGDRTLVSGRGVGLTLRAQALSKRTAAPPPQAVAVQRPSGGATTGGQQPPSAPRGDSDPVQPPNSMDKEKIRDGIKAIIPGVHACYAQAVEKDPKLGGKMTVKFDIREREGEGRIDTAEVVPPDDDDDGGAKQNLDSPLFAQCVLGALSEARFPVPLNGGEVHVTYPFMFSNTED